ncbi:MAG: methionine adenosyltransferase domain-containing protein, partial [Bacilli bacterium]|nr:methionine adenosyltransferase domain-containing protein [Bacilli bacterium]
TFDYDAHKIDTILVSIQHNPNINKIKFKDYVIKNVILPIVKEYKLNTDFKTLINPSGSFVVGGPLGDTGLTGRKLVCDTYGGSAHQGGGALSGKDPTKIDRSATYYARYIAKNLVAAGVAKRLEVEISYAIGVAKPLSISFLTFKTSKYQDELIEKIINKVFDARVGAIIKSFSLNNPKFKYVDTSTYGHFGRDDLSFPWEKLDKVKEIKKLLK